MIRRLLRFSAISLFVGVLAVFENSICDRYAPFVRPLCPPSYDRYAHPYDCYAPLLRPLCPPLTTAMPPLIQRRK